MIKLFFVLISWTTAPSDSLRLETIDGKQFIIHQIDAKETLYSISRRYGVPVTSILENNPASDGGISVGKLLKIPYTSKPKAKTEGAKHIVQPKETLYSIARQYDVSVDDLKKWNNLTENELSLGQELSIGKKAVVINNVIERPKLEQKSLSSTHVVAANQTLYSISRQYNISVQQLKEWNNLQDAEVKIGQMLFITQPAYNGGMKTTETVTATVVRPEIKISESVAGADEIKEEGMAELLEGTEGNRKYLAQHKTIKPGTILKVHNIANNREVFVRITGVLPSTASSDVIMRISKSAYDRLGATDAKLKVEVTYYK